jgi:hypothetical protein
MGGAAVGSAAIGAYSSSRASSAQSQAAGEATQAQRDIADQQTALQREQYLKQLELNAPFREAGLTGQNMLLAQLQGPYGSAKFGGVLGYDPATTMKNFGGVAGYDPASAMRNFGAGDFQADPGYAFRLSEGMKALDRTAASRGGLLSGATLKGAQRFGSDLASQEYGNAYNRFQANRATQSQEYQNAFNRYQAERAAQEQNYGNAYNRFQTERTNTLAPLQSLAGVGQSASQQAQQASAAGRSSCSKCLLAPWPTATKSPRGNTSNKTHTTARAAHRSSAPRTARLAFCTGPRTTPTFKPQPSSLLP